MYTYLYDGKPDTYSTVSEKIVFTIIYKNRCVWKIKILVVLMLLYKKKKKNTWLVSILIILISRRNSILLRNIRIEGFCYEN